MEWNGDILYVCKETDSRYFYASASARPHRQVEACSPPVRSFVARSPVLKAVNAIILKMNESIVMEVDTIGRLDGVGHETVNVGGHKVKVKVTQG